MISGLVRQPHDLTHHHHFPSEASQRFVVEIPQSATASLISTSTRMSKGSSWGRKFHRASCFPITCYKAAPFHWSAVRGAETDNWAKLCALLHGLRPWPCFLLHLYQRDVFVLISTLSHSGNSTGGMNLKPFWIVYLHYLHVELQELSERYHPATTYSETPRSTLDAATFLLDSHFILFQQLHPSCSSSQLCDASALSWKLCFQLL